MRTTNSAQTHLRSTHIQVQTSITMDYFSAIQASRENWNSPFQQKPIPERRDLWVTAQNDGADNRLVIPP